MKDINERTLLEIVETMEQHSKKYAAHFDEELSDEFLFRINEVKELVKQATPPTEEEVCKALSEYWNEEILLNPATCEFMNTECFANDVNKVTHRQITQWYDHDDTYKILVPLPPHLITIIGRFYEDLE